MVRSLLCLSVLLLLAADGSRARASDEAYEESKLAAEARLADAAWAKSCAKATVDGSCAKTLDLKGAGKTRCGPSSATLAVAVKRNAAKVKQSQKHVAAALAIWKAIPSDTKPSDAVADSAAHAMFLSAELEYEAVLASRWPAGLDFSDKKKASETKFYAWIADTNAAIATAKASYMKIVDDTDFKRAKSGYRFAAMARIGQMHARYAQLMFLADIPRDIAKLNAKYAGTVDAYCDAAAAQSTTLETTVREAFQYCVDEAAKTSATGAWPDLCAAELAKLSPTNP